MYISSGHPHPRGTLPRLIIQWLPLPATTATQKMYLVMSGLGDGAKPRNSLSPAQVYTPSCLVCFLSSFPSSLLSIDFNALFFLLLFVLNLANSLLTPAMSVFFRSPRHSSSIMFRKEQNGGAIHSSPQADESMGPYL